MPQGLNFKRKRSQLAGRGWALRCGFATGVAANTNMTITGIKKGDEIVAMLNLAGVAEASGGMVFADVTATAKITAANTVQNTAATNGAAGRQILVFWISR